MNDEVIVVDGMTLDELMKIVRAIPDPSIGDIGRLLFIQGTVMNHIGMELLRGSNGISKKSNAAVAVLSGAEKALSRSAEILKVSGTDAALVEERLNLLEAAYERGYDVAFEVDGRVTLECRSKKYGQLVLDSI